MAGTFWSNFGMRFNPHGSNGLDEILERGEENFTLEEILSHDQVIQECKYMNQHLCEYLSKPHIVRKLIQYIITTPPHDIAESTNTLDVGGSSDNEGGITTAASMFQQRQRSKAAAAAANDASSSAAATASSAAASSSSSSSNSSATQSAAKGTSSESSSAESSDDDENSDSHYPKNLSSTSSGDDEDSGATASRLLAEQKYPYQASELFSCEVSSMLDALFEPDDGLNPNANASQLDKHDEHDDMKDEKSNDDIASSTSGSSSAQSSTNSNSSDGVSSYSAASSSSASAPHYPLLDLLLSFLDQPAPIDPAHASYFRKVMVVLIQRKYEPLVRYMSTHQTLDKLLRHIGLYSIMEILIMIGWDDGLGGNQDVAWLVANDLTGKLIEKLNPVWETEYNQPDVLINASRALVDVVVKCSASTHNPLITRLLTTSCQTILYQHMFSGSFLSLSNALSIVIVLVQRYANRMDLGTEVMDEVKAAALAEQASRLDSHDESSMDEQPNNELFDASSSSTSLPEPFHSLVPHLSRILTLLQSEQPEPQSWSYGRGRAFGETRLKVVELILVLVRCKVAEVEEIFKQEELLTKLLNAFEEYPWNNMLHGLVESILRTILEFLTDTKLKAVLFHDAHLSDRVVRAYEKNEEICAKGKGFRLGFMGHLLRMAEVIEQFLKNSEGETMAAGGDPTNVREQVLGSIESVHRWNNFVNGALASETEACKIILPTLGGGEEEFADGDDTDALANLASNMNLGGAYGSQQNEQKQQHENDHGGEYQFDPDDTSSLAYDYSGQLDHTGGQQNDWADFNSHFSEAAGESPAAGTNTPPHAHAAASSSAAHPASSSSSQPRQLLEFNLNPDEDGDSNEEEEEDDDHQQQPAGVNSPQDWAHFDSPPAPADAPAPPAADPVAAADAVAAESK